MIDIATGDKVDPNEARPPAEALIDEGSPILFVAIRDGRARTNLQNT
jgi:hypothetical protein